MKYSNMRISFVMIKNALLLTVLATGFSRAQTQTVPITQNTVDNTAVQQQILQQLKSIDQKLSQLGEINAELNRMSMANKITSDRLDKDLKDINTNINIKLDTIIKRFGYIDKSMYGEYSAREANMYYRGVGLDKLIEKIGAKNCNVIQGENGEDYKADCSDLQSRAKNLQQVTTLVLKEDVKIMLQDRIQIINRIHEILLMENEKLQIMVDKDKEDKKRKEQDEKDRATLNKSQNKK